MIPEQGQTGLVCGYSSSSKAKVLLLLFAAEGILCLNRKKRAQILRKERHL